MHALVREGLGEFSSGGAESVDGDIDDDDDSPDNEVDLGGDDDLGVETKSKGDDDEADEN